MAELLSDLTWIAGEKEFAITHNEFDAGLCALTGVCDRVEGVTLDKEITEGLIHFGDGYSAPRGYALLKDVPSNVVVQRKPWGQFLQEP